MVSKSSENTEIGVEPLETDTPTQQTRSLKGRLIVFILLLAVVIACIIWILSIFEVGLLGDIIAAVIIAIIACFFFIHSFLSPLQHVCHVANDITLGKYATPEVPTHNDEIGQLTHSLNIISDELKNSDQTRKALIANVSHELRTPVAAMQALAENMADGIVEPTSANLEMIVKEMHRLTDLIAYLLDLSRMEAGTASLEVSTFNIKDFLSEVTKPLIIADAGHNHQISMEVPSDLLIEADRNRLNQLFTNIISNALKHSANNSNVLIECHEDSQNNTIITNVINYGSQIAPEDREKIFRRFISEKGKMGTTSGGTGLGLPIARWAARLHGGDVTVVDDTRGANFEITLPKYHSIDSVK